MIISRVKETIENQKKRILGHETHLEPLIVVVARRCRVGVVMFTTQHVVWALRYVSFFSLFILLTNI
jgi:hypothetical protein